MVRIQQEIGLAAQAKLFWGNSEVLWDKDVPLLVFMLFNAPHVSAEIYEDLDTMCLLGFLYVEESLQDNLFPDSGGHFTLRFWDVPDLTRKCKISDPRDAIYAFLGHTAAQLDHGAIVNADYSKSEQELLLQLSITGLVTERDPAVLHLMYHTNNPNTTLHCLLGLYRATCPRQIILGEFQALVSAQA
jgi:hypothetical protein